MPTQRAATSLRHQDLRDRLLAAAEGAIAADGLPNLRARALADAVGCSVGAIYSVFSDLDTLILEVNARTLADIDAKMRAVSAEAPGEHLVRLATAYLAYAAAHRHRWQALFQHLLPAALPDWYAERRLVAFSHIEAPLRQLQPNLEAPLRARLARTLFAAVHGMVELGLDSVEMPDLQGQIMIVVNAIAAGLERKEAVLF